MATTSEDNGRAAAVVRYSGLETPSMKVVKCSLLIQSSITKFDARVIALDPCRVVVPHDGGPPRNVAFRGCSILQLHPVAGRSGSGGGGGVPDAMPPILTIGGPCRYTPADRKDFEIMMRSREQARRMGLPPNGEMDWPDYRAFQTCPCCGEQAVVEEVSSYSTSSVGERPRYWMLFYPMLQVAPEGMGMRTIARLTCADCFEDLVQDMSLRASVRDVTPPLVQTFPLLDVVEDTGPITWLDRAPRGMGRRGREGDIMSAYTLYLAWETTGAWQAMCNNFSDMFSEGLGGRVEIKATKHDGYRSKKHRAGIDDDDDDVDNDDSDDHAEWIVQRESRVGKVCNGPGCDKIHGNRKIRLQECSGCREVLYCSTECQSKDWPEHRARCKKRQEELKEEDETRKAREKAEQEAKMEEALASFVPLSLAPQGGGGSRKKQGKKKGGGGKGKKKKGKK
eukprot:CAMPEP_0178673916 /NCGR_PEP_ID=MMETSP0698-20121128/34560_1 /TAXON_ID=265572 /ORGANISM="Extubocellulus spinifer, Strain CCMP396" /LENGTH=451 /DNA_ID=CAMNT_0020317965 /DNA_START=17 /DNA_END=1372 /DNA_ORIENTATION=+